VLVATTAGLWDEGCYNQEDSPPPEDNSSQYATTHKAIYGYPTLKEADHAKSGLKDTTSETCVETRRKAIITIMNQVVPKSSNVNHRER